MRVSPSVPEVVMGLPDTERPVGVVIETDVTVPLPDPPPRHEPAVEVAKHVAIMPPLNEDVAVPMTASVVVVAFVVVAFPTIEVEATRFFINSVSVVELKLKLAFPPNAVDVPDWYEN